HAILPFPYKTFADRVYGQAETVNFKKLFSEMDYAFNDKRGFSKYHNYILNIVKSSNDLERYLMSNFKLNLKDVCEPGVFKINLIDVVKFLEIAETNLDMFKE